MPLTMVNIGETKNIVKITGKDETRRFLENLGFVEGTAISGNMIVSVRDARVAIDRSMANRIMV